jgi:hypothetical protein
LPEFKYNNKMTELDTLPAVILRHIITRVGDLYYPVIAAVSKKMRDAVCRMAPRSGLRAVPMPRLSLQILGKHPAFATWVTKERDLPAVQVAAYAVCVVDSFLSENNHAAIVVLLERCADVGILNPIVLGLGKRIATNTGQSITTNHIHDRTKISPESFADLLDDGDMTSPHYFLFRMDYSTSVFNRAAKRTAFISRYPASRHDRVKIAVWAWGEIDETRRETQWADLSSIKYDEITAMMVDDIPAHVADLAACALIDTALKVCALSTAASCSHVLLASYLKKFPHMIMDAVAQKDAITSFKWLRMHGCAVSTGAFAVALKSSSRQVAAGMVNLSGRLRNFSQDELDVMVVHAATGSPLTFWTDMQAHGAYPWDTVVARGLWTNPLSPTGYIKMNMPDISVGCMISCIQPPDPSGACDYTHALSTLREWGAPWNPSEYIAIARVRGADNVIAYIENEGESVS